MDKSKIKILLYVGCVSFTFKINETNQSCYLSVKNSQIVKKNYQSEHFFKQK